MTIGIRPPQPHTEVRLFKASHVSSMDGQEIFHSQEIRAQDIYAQVSPGTKYYSSMGRYFEERGAHIERITDEGIISELKRAEGEFEKGDRVEYLGTRVVSWNFLKKAPSLLGVINRFILWFTNLSAIKMDVVLLKDYYPAQIAGLDQINTKLQAIKADMEEKGVVGLGISRAEYDDRMARVNELAEAISYWNVALGNVNLELQDNGVDAAMVYLAQLEPNFTFVAEIISKNTSIHQFIEEYSIKGVAGVDVKGVVFRSKGLIDKTIGMARAEGYQPTDALEAAYTGMVKTTDAHHLWRELENQLLKEEEFIQKLELVVKFGGQKSHLFLYHLRKQGLNDGEIKLFFHSCQKALAASKEMKKDLQDVAIFARRGEFKEAMDLYGWVMEERLVNYREGLKDLTIISRFGQELIKGRPGVHVDPFTAGMREFAKALIKEKITTGIPTPDAFDIQANTHFFGVVGALDSKIAAWNAKVVPGDDQIDIVVVRKAQTEQLKEANKEIAPVEDLINQNVDLVNKLLSMPTNAQLKVRLNELGLDGLDLYQFSNIYNQYAQVIVPLYMASVSLKAYPNDPAIKAEVQRLWKKHEKEVKKLRKDFAKFGMAKAAKFVDLMEMINEDAGGVKQLNYGEILLKRVAFIDNLEERLSLKKEVFGSQLLTFPKQHQARWGAFLKANGWSENLIQRLDKLNFEYGKAVDTLQQAHNQYKQGKISRAQLQAIVKKSKKTIDKYQKRLNAEFGGKRGLEGLNRAMTFMQAHLEEAQSKAGERTGESRQIKLAMRGLAKGRESLEVFERRKAFLDILYQETNLASNIVKESINELMKETNQSIGEFDRAGWTAEDTERFNELYHRYGNQINNLINLKQEYDQTHDPKVKEAIRKELGKRIRGIRETKNDIAPYLTKLTSATVPYRDAVKQKHERLLADELDSRDPELQRILSVPLDQRTDEDIEFTQHWEGLQDELELYDRTLKLLDKIDFVGKVDGYNELVDEIEALFEGFPENYIQKQVKMDQFEFDTPVAWNQRLREKGITNEQILQLDQDRNYIAAKFSTLSRLGEKVKANTANIEETATYTATWQLTKEACDRYKDRWDALHFVILEYHTELKELVREKQAEYEAAREEDSPTRQAIAQELEVAVNQLRAIKNMTFSSKMAYYTNAFNELPVPKIL